MNKVRIYSRLSFKITVMVVTMVLICSALVGTFMSQDHKSNLFRLKGLTARTAAESLASALDSDKIQELYSTEQENEYYSYLIKTIRTAGEHTGFKYLYILARAENGTDFKVICGVSGSGDYSAPLGFLVPASALNEAALRAYETGEHTHSRPYSSERYGYIMSGYAPVLSAEGKVVAMVGMDIPLDDIVADFAYVRNTTVLIIAAFAVLFSVISIIYTRRRIGSPLAAISEMSAHVAEGDLEYDPIIKSRDEIGLLYANFKRTQFTINELREDVRDLIKDASDGILDRRAKADNYPGDWGELASELNHLLDEVARTSETILSSIDYASKIQKNLLPQAAAFEKAFSDHSILWSPRDIVGGDIYWIKNFSEGTLLCVCDCTGHGAPGAMLTMLVVSAFEDTVNESNYKDTAQVLWNLEQRLISVFNVCEGNRIKGKIAEVQDGCDLAVLFIAKDGCVTTSAGHTNVFVCDGKEVKKIRGQNISVGEGKIKSKDDIKTVIIPAGANNKFYVATDGLFDQMGGNPLCPFGYKRFTKIILERHNEEQSVISGAVWEAFESYRGEQPRRDDVELITFRP